MICSANCPGSTPSSIAPASSARAAAASRLDRAAGQCRGRRSSRAVPSIAWTSSTVIRSPTKASNCSSRDWLSRIEPAARRASSCSASGSAVAPSCCTIYCSRSTISAVTDRGKIESLAARQHRDRNLARLGRAEDEFHVLRRLFQRLQQRVERLLGQHVHFVDDVDLEASPAGTDTDVGPQLADFVDAAVAGTVDLQHVHIVAAGDLLADVALPAGVGVGPCTQFSALARDAGGRGLADAAGTGKQIGVPDAFVSRSRFAAPGRPSPARPNLRTSEDDTGGRPRHIRPLSMGRSAGVSRSASRAIRHGG